MQNKIRLVCAATAGAMLLSITSVSQAISLGQVDSFQDGGVGGFGGGASPTNIATGGLAGASDKFLQITSSGGFGPGSKLITFNRSQWLGDYGAAGVNTISMDLKDLSGIGLVVRLAFKDGTGGGAGGYSTTDTASYVLPADSAWHHAVFSLSSTSFTNVNGASESFDALIGGPAEFRILSSSSPSLDGDGIAGSIGIDNITSAAVSVPEPTTLSLGIFGSAAMLKRRRR